MFDDVEWRGRERERLPPTRRLDGFGNGCDGGADGDDDEAVVAMMWNALSLGMLQRVVDDIRKLCDNGVTKAVNVED